MTAEGYAPCRTLLDTVGTVGGLCCTLRDDPPSLSHPTLSLLLPNSNLHHLGILLVQVVGPGLASVLLQVNLADKLNIGRPSEGVTIVVERQLVGDALLVLVSESTVTKGASTTHLQVTATKELRSVDSTCTSLTSTPPLHLCRHISKMPKSYDPLTFSL